MSGAGRVFLPPHPVLSVGAKKQKNINGLPKEAVLIFLAPPRLRLRLKMARAKKLRREAKEELRSDFLDFIVVRDCKSEFV